MYQIPTDSLYKFCAITGIITILFSIYLPYSIFIDTNKQLITMKYEATKLNLEVNYTNEDIKEISENVKEMDKELTILENKSIKLTEIEIKRLKDFAKEFNIKNNSLKKLIREHEIKVEQLKATQEKLETILNFSDFILKIGNFGRVLGFILSCFGFIMWYKKIQKPQDELILKSLKN